MSPPAYDEGRGALYPADERSGGTWILTSRKGFTLNILNGAYERHDRHGPYRHSRGLVPLLYAYAGSMEDFQASFDPSGLEPFTLVVVEHDPRRVVDLEWTGAQLDRVEHPAHEPRIWSSSTLYSERVRRDRTSWFDEAMRAPRCGTPLETLRRFHLTGGADQAPVEDRIRMGRHNGPETVCLAGVERNTRCWSFYFHDLVRDQERTACMIG
jgi:hypothetical protein